MIQRFLFQIKIAFHSFFFYLDSDMFINLFEILRLARHFDPSIHKDLQWDFNFERV